MPRLTTLKSRLGSIPSALKTVSTDTWRAGKEGGTARGYGYRWQKARERFLSENPICCYCHRAGRPLTLATIVDHKIPHRGDERLFWDETNWQPLCKPCHDGEKKRQENQGL